MDAPKMTVPLHIDKDGNIRVGGTRVTLDTIVASYQQGETPQEIHEGFPTLKLADIYAVISHYLNNQEEVDAYLRRQEEEAEQIRQQLEAENPEIFELENKFRELLAKQEK